MNAQFKSVTQLPQPTRKTDGYFYRCAKRMEQQWILLLGPNATKDAAQACTVVLLAAVFLVGFLPTALWITGRSLRDNSN